MSKKIQKEIEGLLFEIYDNGVQQKECDLTIYYEKINQALNIPIVTHRRELLIAFVEWANDSWINIPKEQVNNMIAGFEKSNL